MGKSIVSEAYPIKPWWVEVRQEPPSDQLDLENFGDSDTDWDQSSDENAVFARDGGNVVYAQGYRPARGRNQNGRQNLIRNPNNPNPNNRQRQAQNQRNRNNPDRQLRIFNIPPPGFARIEQANVSDSDSTVEADQAVPAVQVVRPEIVELAEPEDHENRAGEVE